MKTKTLLLTAAAAAALALSSGAASAQSQGDWLLGVGVGHVKPKDDNGTLAGAATTIDGNTQLTLTAEYFIRDRIGIELLAATPFKHTATIAGVGTATTKHLPPTLTLHYYFTNNSKVTPFVGAGINFTTFFQTESALGNVEFDNSIGLALHAGLDFAISDRGSLRTDVRWMDIDTDVKLGGAAIGTAEIDPMVFGVSYVHRF